MPYSPPARLRAAVKIEWLRPVAAASSAGWSREPERAMPRSTSCSAATSTPCSRSRDATASGEDRAQCWMLRLAMVVGVVCPVLEG
jgi:hypothetical protein